MGIKQWFVLIIFLITISTSSLSNSAEAGNDNVITQGKSYKQVDGITEKEAINRFKKLYNHDPNISNLAQQIPFKVTHTYGYLEKNNSQALELDFLNEHSKAQFKIMVYPIEKKIPLSKAEKHGTMSDGTNYTYRQIDKYRIFRFETKNYAYILSSNNNEQSEESLIQVFEKIAAKIKTPVE
ncbi:hypothetical protein [Bacillus sp. UMB0893]|uniref:hypothetical protein n=1 Tax=Bacillus sp. UMB0893 TaxID=2066053 RepID=UPI0008A96E6E|nr:hypothetical protein [Bacillus sp. UMB0893]OHR74075.1 hypothetical protein HMPREF3291_00145 [Bacillus sp. HMSC76G11]PLR65627.1 hypothetical protein CYJ36_22520 [Bacillus sp. UMB0893]